MKNCLTLVALTFVALLAACSNPGYDQFQSAMKKAGYTPLKNPESNINPGDIYDLQDQTIEHAVPPKWASKLTGTNDVDFTTVKDNYSLSGTAAASLASKTISSSPILSATLSGNYTKSISVDLGETHKVYIPTDYFTKSELLKTSNNNVYIGDINDLTSVLKTGKLPVHNVVVVSVISKGMNITVTTTTAAAASALANFVNAHTTASANIMGSGSNTVVLSPPQDKTYMLGVKYLSPSAFIK